MHISDGILSTTAISGGWVVTIVIAILSFWWRYREVDVVEEIPKFSVMTAAFFVASLIHIPLGPTSVHLIFNGLVGVILGPLAYVAMLVGLTLQAFLFQHGGVTTIGVNTMNVGIPALLCFYIFKKGVDYGLSEKIIGGISGGLAVFFTTILLSISLLTTGEEFLGVAGVAAAAHLPVMIIEGIVTASVVTYLAKVKPELLPVKLNK
ncbi:cobalt transporter CbiM [Methanohalophilus portucalensis]|uniref:Cobalamin (Vitamin B12) biosynthesis CbiM protein n=2 Tax=Methanohalophilus portucalensis TaxID=39664 RepID=A0A1L9C340_9EURY|nr:cobalt transporter CbiM [Methanohalophilus portucalensis]ATU07564.1 cobalamin biosynthesis protein CbiM [Methanohalophilus portucalensis]OJH48959.1 cobalamin (vitamin B12) biosynthesis CbiM protein [Methanohalophilus portucalensis FDF-1]RNI10290.1 cobalt transporter CbiM [Methanohalophilus portucalensis FDF-1]SMH38078.1 cobalt/nickel transport system permease protein [Methanohalophilus portucalensis FDF-1]